MVPFISICIPAYNRTNFLKRLLQSIEMQIWKDFEVIICDDSTGNDVELLVKEFRNSLPVFYYKNIKSLGTPANWNEAIKHAKGKWIKLMHDDDWFATETSLQQFAEAAENNDNCFIFSAFIKVTESTEEEKIVYPEKYRMNLVEKEPAILLAKNFIGHPSVTMHKNDEHFLYDPQLKWLVDIDMYIRRIEKNKLFYIPQPLIKIGISDSQVTSNVKDVADIEIPEHFHLLNKTGTANFRNVLVYDYWWRFIRNFKIRNVKDFATYGYAGEVPSILAKMIAFQKNIPHNILKIGTVSKLIMAAHFMMNKRSV